MQRERGKYNPLIVFNYQNCNKMISKIQSLLFFVQHTIKANQVA